MTAPALVLIGPPGVGKSTIGQLVATRLGLPFADTDDAIVATSGQSIPQIFAEQGEPQFRRLEAEAVADALTNFDGVLALGGGAVMTPAVQVDLASYVANGGKVVFLDMDPDAAALRLIAGGRPLLAGTNPLAKWGPLYQQRKPIYERASNHRIDTSDLSPLEVAEIIEKNNYPPKEIKFANEAEFEAFFHYGYTDRDER